MVNVLRLKGAELKYDVGFLTHNFIILYYPIKGQLISKAKCQAVNSSKKRTNEFDFTTKRLVFVRFLEEIDDS